MLALGLAGAVVLVYIIISIVVSIGSLALKFWGRARADTALLAADIRAEKEWEAAEGEAGDVAKSRAALVAADRAASKAQVRHTGASASAA